MQINRLAVLGLAGLLAASGPVLAEDTPEKSQGDAASNAQARDNGGAPEELGTAASSGAQMGKARATGEKTPGEGIGGTGAGVGGTGATELNTDDGPQREARDD